jgi:hypothetical protein
MYGITTVPLDLPELQWMDEHISKEFEFFETYGIQQEDVEKTWEHVHSQYGRYQVIDSKVYGPEGTIRNLLEVMVQHYKVPDVDFIYAHRDNVDTIPQGSNFRTAPIFGSTKTKSVRQAITFVDWYYDILIEEKPGWNKLHRELIANKYKWEWRKKIEKLFWRGAATDADYTLENWTQFPRGKLVHLSHYVVPNEIDASFCVFMGNWLARVSGDADQFRKQIPYSPLIPQIDHLQYKYQIALDGTTATYPGYQWRLLSGCLTFKQETDEIMWFYAGLKPWVHYVPVEKDLSDILEKIHWAKANDVEARGIARRAHKFALNNLMPRHILLYCYKALVKYASLQRFTPTPYTKPQPPHLCPAQK